uniref:Uncharacterized protein n=1 Tax=Medicago truncatula TaxID=3880 RepID=Q1RUA1_MEDTR|nr:hypothetical protein MtrDRAFT_AC153123g40v2 [Medicago truncatula]
MGVDASDTQIIVPVSAHNVQEISILSCYGDTVGYDLGSSSIRKEGRLDVVYVQTDNLHGKSTKRNAHHHESGGISSQLDHMNDNIGRPKKNDEKSEGVNFKSGAEQKRRRSFFSRNKNDDEEEQARRRRTVDATASKIMVDTRFLHEGYG